MGDISQNFYRSEFRCTCGQCDCDTVDSALIEALEVIRANFNAPVFVTSGHRCFDHNAGVGGGRHSQHLYGKAADIIVKDTHPDDVADYCEAVWPDRYGIGRYDSWTHLDVRSGMARWDNRS